MSTVSTFDLKDVQELRRRASATWTKEVPAEDTPEGWSESPFDVAKIVAAFPPLRIKPTMTLRAYQFLTRDDGNGVVWAMPQSEPLPQPRKCRKTGLPRHAWALGAIPDLKAPRPPKALDDPMKAIEGDGTPWSYLCASLLARELDEFGAFGHGSNWVAFHILGSDPWSDAHQAANAYPDNAPTGTPADWQWPEPKPVEWRPTVSLDTRSAIVTFYTFCGLGGQRITRHVDTYTLGQYWFDADERTIAAGPRGYVW